MRFDLARYWYQPSLTFCTFLLLPFAWLFHLCIAIRRKGYQLGILKTYHFPIPVIVVGNITVGGTGKTPFVIWLAQFLKTLGYAPGIVSRGVGGKNNKKSTVVERHSLTTDVGDEAVLLANNTDCPIVIGRDRVAAVENLLKNFSCNIIISDDGLQHYRLGRHIEIALIDGRRRFGNNQLLPAGPLREPLTRLNKVNFIVANDDHPTDEFAMSLEPVQFISLKHPHRKFRPEHFPHKQIHAIAGIGHPTRFFLMLKKLGFEVIAHPFPDHHPFQLTDFNHCELLPIIMTEKDAVKCLSFADDRYWYLQVSAKINNKLQVNLKKILQFGGSQ